MRWLIVECKVDCQCGSPKIKSMWKGTVAVLSFFLFEQRFPSSYLSICVLLLSTAAIQPKQQSAAMKSDTAENRNVTPQCIRNNKTKEANTTLENPWTPSTLTLQKKKRCSYSLLVSTLASMMLLNVTVSVRQIGGIGRMAAGLSHSRCLFTCTATHCEWHFSDKVTNGLFPT